jgi:hypothetical protein
VFSLCLVKSSANSTNTAGKLQQDSARHNAPLYD